MAWSTWSGVAPTVLPWLLAADWIAVTVAAVAPALPAAVLTAFDAAAA